MRLFTYTIISLAFVVLVFLAGCAQKTVGIAEMRSYYSDVQKCLGLEGITFPKPKLTIVPGVDEVIHPVTGKEYKGLYFPDDIWLPENSDINTIKHEFVHHFVYHTTGLGTDPLHEAKTGGESSYLKCSGLEVE
jgi:hypothetical protein